MPAWRNPAAWFGLVALAIPIAVHLLARTRAQVIAFPSLRFIDVSRLAARKRRQLSDVALLALRLLALTLAIAAYADPLWLTASRRAAWGARVSRAVVIDTSPSMSRGRADEEATRAAARELDPAAASAAASASASAPASASAAASASASTSAPVLRQTTVRAASLRDGVARAVAWLRTAPPSRREIVIISDFQAGTIDAALLREVPDDVGLRFTRVGGGPAAAAHEATVDARAVSARSANGSGFEWTRARVRVTENATAVVNRTPVAAPTAAATTAAADASPAPIVIAPSDTGFMLKPFGLRVSVSPAGRPIAFATLQAVLTEGVPAPAQPSHAVHLMLTTADTTGARSPIPTADATGAPSRIPTPSDVGPISAGWMADVLQHLATDSPLGDAVAAAADVSAAPAAGSTTSVAAVDGGATTDRAPAPDSAWRVILTDARGTPVLLAASRAAATAPAGNNAHADARELWLLARLRASSPATALLFRSALTALAAPDTIADAEVRTIPDSALRVWTHPAAEPSTDALRNVEESDRRWLWAAALAVLFIETWFRRDRQRASREQVEVHEHAA